MGITTEVPQTGYYKTGSNKRRNLIIALIVVFLLTCGSLAYGYMVLDLFKSPKQIYFEIEAQNYQKMRAELGQSYENYYNDYLKPYLENAVHTNLEITASLGGIPEDDPAAKIFLDVLKKSKIVMDVSADEKNQQYLSKFDLALENTNLLGMELLADKTKVALKVPVLYDKYAFLDLKDREKIMEKYDIPNLPKRIVTNQEVLEAIKLNPEEIKVLESYALFYADNLEKSQVTVTKGVFDEGETKQDCRVVTVSFNQEQIQNLQKKILDKAAQDEKLLDLLYARQQKILKLLDDSGYDLKELNLKQKEKAEIREDIKKLAANIKPGEAGALNGLTMVLYVDDKDNLLDRQVTLEDNTAKVLLRTASWQTKDQKVNYLLNLKDLKDNAGELKLTYAGTPLNGKTPDGKLSATFKAAETDIKFDGVFSTEKESGREKGDYTFTISAGQTKVQGEVKSDLLVNKKEKNRNGNSSVKLSFFVPEITTDTVNLNLNMKYKEEFGIPVQVPALDGGNAVDLANLSDEQLLQIEEDIQLNLSEFIMSNAQLFQTFMMY